MSRLWPVLFLPRLATDYSNLLINFDWGHVQCLVVFLASYTLEVVRYHFRNQLRQYTTTPRNVINKSSGSTKQIPPLKIITSIVSERHCLHLSVITTETGKWQPNWSLLSSTGVKYTYRTCVGHWQEYYWTHMWRINVYILGNNDDDIDNSDAIVLPFTFAR